MTKRSPVLGALLSVAAVSAGCDAFLGLDDKQFGTTTTFPTGGTTSSVTGGNSTGGDTGGTATTVSAGGMGGTGGTGGATGGTTGGGGTTTTGDPCLEGAVPDRVTDDFEFPLCNGGLDDTGTSLKARGWHLDWQEDPQGEVSNVGLNVFMGRFDIIAHKSYLWFDGKPGPFVEKTISGDFLIVTDVTVFQGADPATPPNHLRAGGGILIRDPASVGTALEHWIAVDRGADSGTPAVHGSWSDGIGTPETQSTASSPGETSGKLALCRQGNQLHIYTKSGVFWTNQDSMLSGFFPEYMPDTVQAGLFLTSYDNPETSYAEPVTARFHYVRQYDLMNGSCDPESYLE